MISSMFLCFCLLDSTHKAIKNHKWALSPLFIALYSLILLTGCDRSSVNDHFETYNIRLAYVLDTEPAQLDDIEMVSLPSPRDLQLPIEDLRINLLDAYEMRKCGLFNLIAERNSILGKVQDKTRQLRYELLLIHGMQFCLDTLPSSSELRTLLITYQHIKKQQLPLQLWNMITTDKEWRQQLVVFHKSPDINQLHGFNETISAFRYLNFLQHQIHDSIAVTPKQADRLLFHQKQIHTFHYFGQLIYSLKQTTQRLHNITRMLERQESSIICSKNRNQQKAEVLGNVFYKYFVTDLQPYMSKLDSQYRQIQPILQTLLIPPTQLSIEFHHYYHAYINGTLHHDFKEATLKHVNFWRRTFKRCDISVGTH
ncbi:DUF3080 domain-containing protein [Photobacterium nomapromontoriensis]|uniref:DUF3080 domain-containing protein n=1 Tax=Photobacterium nomapromontoriensis TaxID=2910237 RepID=UPI003D0A08E7